MKTNPHLWHSNLHHTRQFTARFRLLMLGLAVVLGAGVGKCLACLQDEMDLIDQVRGLEAQLADESISKRDQAQKKLTELGSKVLDILIPVDATMSTDMQSRLRTIRLELELEVAKLVSKPSKVNLTGKQTLKEVLKALHEQTGNEIDLSEQADQALLDGSIECNWQDADFWKTVLDVTRQSKLVLERYEGERRQLVLSPMNPNVVAQIEKMDAARERYTPVTATTGVLSMEVNRIDTSIFLADPNVSHTSIDMTVRWEPRLRPIAIDLPYAEITVTDDLGTIIKPPDEGVASILIQPEFASSEFSLQIPLLERKAKQIADLDGIVNMMVPGRMEKFIFPRIDEASPGIWQEKASATVTFGGITKNEDLYALRLSLSFAKENNMLESHQSWAFENPVYLTKENGERIDPIGMETFEQSDASVGVTYLFPEIPPGSNLNYETPSAIVKLSMPFALKKIPLP